MIKIIKYLGSQKSQISLKTPPGRDGFRRRGGGQFGPIFINSISRAKLHNFFKPLTVKIGL